MWVSDSLIYLRGSHTYVCIKLGSVLLLILSHAYLIIRPAKTILRVKGKYVPPRHFTILKTEWGDLMSSSLFPVTLSCPDLPYLSWGLACSENHTPSGKNAGCDALLTHTWYPERVSFVPDRPYMRVQCSSHILTSPRSPHALMSACAYNYPQSSSFTLVGAWQAFPSLGVQNHFKGAIRL